jgi:hypothetical protein
VTPRQVTIQGSATRSLSGKQEPSEECFHSTQNIQGIICAVYFITRKEFGKIIFAKQSLARLYLQNKKDASSAPSGYIFIIKEEKRKEGTVN